MRWWIWRRTLSRTEIQTEDPESKKSHSKPSLGVDQRGIVLQDRSGVVDHVINDLLSGEDLVYLSSDATGKPWPGTERLLGVFLEILFNGEDALFEESLCFGLTVIFPGVQDQNQYPSQRREHLQPTNRQRKGS